MKRIKFSEIRLHPWLRENVPFYIEIFNLNTKLESHRKINEDVLTKLISTKKIDFHGLTEDKIRRAIKKHEDYSFVIAYDLLLDEFNKSAMTT